MGFNAPRCADMLTNKEVIIKTHICNTLPLFICGKRPKRNTDIFSKQRLTFVLLPKVKNKLAKRLNSLQVLINMNFQIRVHGTPLTRLGIMAAASERRAQEEPPRSTSCPTFLYFPKVSSS